MWGHVTEKAVEKLGFAQKPRSPSGPKIQQMALEKTLFPRELPIGPKNYLQHPYFVLDLVPGQISNPQKYFFGSEAGGWALQGIFYTLIF
jgi:hypothetical protein